jgi:hypothetical protein
VEAFGQTESTTKGTNILVAGDPRLSAVQRRDEEATDTAGKPL